MKKTIFILTIILIGLLLFGCSQPNCGDGKCDKSINENKASCPQDCELMCAQQNGVVCGESQTCLGNWIVSVDSSNCCIGACEELETQTCAQQNGYVCGQTQTCDGTLFNASDSANCCSVECTNLELEQVVLEKVVFSDDKYFRPELIVIGEKLFAAWTIKRRGYSDAPYKIVELNKTDLTPVSQIFDLYNYPTSVDFRLATDGTNLWYPFQRFTNKDWADCNSIFLGLAKYGFVENNPIRINSKLDIAKGCPFDNRHLENYPQNPELVDDPTPFFYDEKYFVLTRAWKGMVQHIRVFDGSFNLSEDFTLDLSPILTDKEFLSQNALVEIEGNPYLIGGLGTLQDSSIYAIPLSSDLHLILGSIIPLVKEAGQKYTKTTSAKYKDGKLYINYAKATPNGQFHNLGIFDVKNNFASLYQIQFQDVSVNANHTSIEVLDNKVYVIYQEDQQNNYDLLMQVFEWR